MNLEPVYGIVLGALIFQENKSLNTQFYVGAAVVVATVFAGPTLQYLRERHLTSTTEPKAPPPQRRAYARVDTTASAVTMEY